MVPGERKRPIPFSRTVRLRSQESEKRPIPFSRTVRLWSQDSEIGQYHSVGQYCYGESGTLEQVFSPTFEYQKSRNIKENQDDGK